MNQLLRLCFLFIFAVLTASGAPLVIPLWPEGVPGLKPDAVPDVAYDHRYTNVHFPTLTMYAPTPEKSTGVAVVWSPGGGYVRVGDGKGDAEWLNSLGITTFVLKYRLQEYGHPAPLQDVLRAMRIVRSRATEFGIRPDRIGVMGGSAGGHLSACAVTLWDSPDGKTGDPLDEISARPNFAGLIYPVITMADPFVHKGSRRALLRGQPTPELIEALSIENHVRTNTPPCFIVATMADRSVPVENSLQLYQALRDAKVPSELHAYGAGSHGNSLDPQYGPTAEWPKRCEEWLRFNKFLASPIHDFDRWEKEIGAMEAADLTNAPPHRAILFAGSSTIKLWSTLATDFPDVLVINRGFGGSEIVDSTHFAERLIIPVVPRQIFFRAGGNDLQTGKSATEVFADFKAFVTTIHAKLPETEIVWMSWNNTPLRWQSAVRERAMDALVRDYAQTEPKVKYLDTAAMAMDAEGKPRPELFRSDRLHFNAEGYKLLAETVRPYLMTAPHN